MSFHYTLYPTFNYVAYLIFYSILHLWKSIKCKLWNDPLIYSVPHFHWMLEQIRKSLEPPEMLLRWVLHLQLEPLTTVCRRLMVVKSIYNHKKEIVFFHNIMRKVTGKKSWQLERWVFEEVEVDKPKQIMLDCLRHWKEE